MITQQSGLATSRSIPPLNRKKLKENNLSDWKKFSEERSHISPTFSLKSGRVIRQVNGAPQIHKRNWKLPVSHSFESKDVTKTKLEGYSLLGEVSNFLFSITIFIKSIFFYFCHFISEQQKIKYLHIFGYRESCFSFILFSRHSFISSVSSFFC
jgi:hypothetical protein